MAVGVSVEVTSGAAILAVAVTVAFAGAELASEAHAIAASESTESADARSQRCEFTPDFYHNDR